MATSEVDPSPQDPAAADGVSENASTPESAPVLNRAQRRAQQKGGKAGGGASPRSASPQSGGGGARPSGQAGQVRFPRTGHK